MSPLVFLAPVGAVLVLLLLVLALRARPPRIRFDHGIRAHRRHMQALSSDGPRPSIEATGVTILGPVPANRLERHMAPDDAEA